MTVGANSFAQNTVLHKQVRMNSHLQFQLQKSKRYWWLTNRAVKKDTLRQR